MTRENAGYCAMAGFSLVLGGLSVASVLSRGNATSACTPVATEVRDASARILGQQYNHFVYECIIHSTKYQVRRPMFTDQAVVTLDE